MEFKIEQSVLKEELGFLQGVLERKETIPILSNILCESIGENTVRMTGTDLDVTIRCDVEAIIEQPGKVCLPGRKLFDIVRSLNEGEIKIRKESSGDWVEVTAGRGRFRLAGYPSGDFPEIPVFKSAPHSLPASVFAYLIKSTSFAVTTEVSRFALSGAKMIFNGEKVTMVSTDGHRLALIEKNLDEKECETFEALIPRKALNELYKASRYSTSPFTFGEDHNHLYFQASNKLMIARKLTGSFPNYEMVLPKDVEKKVSFDLQEMRKAVHRVSLIPTEINRPVRMTIREGEIEVKSHGTDVGEGVEIVPADYSGEETVIGFNSRYLLEYFNSVVSFESADAAENEAPKATDSGGSAAVPAKSGGTSTRILLEFSQPNTPTQMRIDADTGYDYRYVVMPLRI